MCPSAKRYEGCYEWQGGFARRLRDARSLCEGGRGTTPRSLPRSRLIDLLFRAEDLLQIDLERIGQIQQVA